jgi:hypothetical protein
MIGQAEYAMNLADRKLVRDITFVIVIKLIFITALWWAFIRDAKVGVDAGTMASQMAAPARSGQSKHMGERNDQ